MEYVLLNRAIKVLIDNNAEDSGFHAMTASRCDTELAMDSILALSVFKSIMECFQTVQWIITGYHIILLFYSNDNFICIAAKLKFKKQT